MSQEEGSKDEHAEKYAITLRSLSEEKLKEMTGGCTEFTCPYHGPINMELKRRMRKRKK